MIKIFEEKNTEIISYCLAHLMSASQLKEFYPLAPSAGNKADKIRHLAGVKGRTITLEEVGDFCRSRWKGPNVKMHLGNLKSGALREHSWHGTRPSTLHLSLQGKVREVCAGKMALNDLIKIGEDITKHEYFMVAVADLCEDLIIRKFDAIPSIINRGISDFVFRGYPFDLKNTTVPSGWTFDKARKNTGEFAESLVSGADVERLRKQAAMANTSWANNRFFVVAENENVWLEAPEKTLENLSMEISSLGIPLSVSADGLSLLCHAVFLPAGV